MGHRKVESSDQAILQQYKNQVKKVGQSDVQSYANHAAYSNSENIKSD